MWVDKHFFLSYRLNLTSKFSAKMLKRVQHDETHKNIRRHPELVSGSLILSYLFILFFSSCSPKTEAHFGKINILDSLQTDTTIKYAKRFSIASNKYCNVVFLFGSKDIKDTSATYIFLKKDGHFKKGEVGKSSFKNPFFVKPNGFKKIASLSSLYCSMLTTLGETESIVAIESIDYYNNPAILNKFKAGTILELARNPQIDVENTIKLNPDIIFTFGMGEGEKDHHKKIIQAGIPMVIIVDHLEETPLARAEWIKFFAAFVNKRAAADSVFNVVEKNYISLTQIASTAKTKPGVFSEVKYGDIWYVPGGNSFAAKLYKDANANYIWENDKQTGSLHLSFEEVYAKAKDADFWLNPSTMKAKTELIGADKRHAEFKAYKTNGVYNNNKTSNKLGYSDYWETGIMYPDRILSDLILIFHPELKDQIKNDLYYYRKLD